jgi:hypothetical protein
MLARHVPFDVREVAIATRTDTVANSLLQPRGVPFDCDQATERSLPRLPLTPDFCFRLVKLSLKPSRSFSLFLKIRHAKRSRMTIRAVKRLAVNATGVVHALR